MSHKRCECTGFYDEASHSQLIEPCSEAADHAQFGL
jgi:hypothetical protein